MLIRLHVDAVLDGDRDYTEVPVTTGNAEGERVLKPIGRKLTTYPLYEGNVPVEAMVKYPREFTESLQGLDGVTAHDPKKHFS
ncbi:MAG: hypothetical protein ACYCQJ_14425 [Nitrososphaerales archaeon]